MSLSDATRLAFDTWPQWRLALDEPPTIIRRLPGGLTNQLYLLKAAGLRLVLRVNNKDSDLLGIDRQREQQILEQIQGESFAPVVFYCDPEQQVLVTEYIEGYQWQPEDLKDEGKLDSLLELIRLIHRVKRDIPPFDYAAHLKAYMQRLLESKQPFPMSALKLYKGIETGLPAFEAAIKEPVLCHHDLTPENIIETDDGRMIVLDWEYAGGGSLLIEAMGVARYWNSPELSAGLIDPASSEVTLQLARDIVDFCDLAWGVLIRSN